MADNDLHLSTHGEIEATIPQRIEELKVQVQSLIQDLLEKQSFYDTLRRRTPAASRAEKEAARASAEEARSELQFSQSALATLIASNESLVSPTLASPNSTDPGSGTSSASPQAFPSQESHKRVQRIKIRPFYPDKPGTKADLFWTYFQGLCLNNKLNLEESFLLLSNACDEGRPQNWFRLNFFESKKPPKTLQETKDSFYAAFLSPNWKTDRFFELLLTLWQPNESVAGYFERFSNAATMFESSVAATEPADARLLKDLFWYHMPTTVRRTLGSKNHQEDFASCQELFLFVNSGFPGVPSDVVESQKTIRSILQKSLNPMVTVVGRLGKKMFCSHCQTGTHDTEFCRKRKSLSGIQEQNPRLKSTPPQRGKDYDEMKKKGVCFRCGTTWSKGHKCVRSDSPDYGKGLVFRRTFIDGDMDMESHLSDLEKDTPILSAIKVSTANDHSRFLKAPILLNNIKVLGGIDTYASHSFVSPDLVRELKAEVIPASGTIILGAASARANRIGRVTDVMVSVRSADGNTLQTRHTFEVLDMGANCNCLIGLDLLPKLGIVVENIPASFPSKDPVGQEDDSTFDNPLHEELVPKDANDPLLSCRAGR
jgi:hypothetical protein